jgi:hypothetical protein
MINVNDSFAVFLSLLPATPPLHRKSNNSSQERQLKVNAVILSMEALNLSQLTTILF